MTSVGHNIKPGVIKFSRYESVLNQTYADLLEQYGAHAVAAGWSSRTSKSVG